MFFTGFLLTISSPLSILFWLGIYGSIFAKTINRTAHDELFIHSSMIFLGLMVWDVFVACLTTIFRKFLEQRTLMLIAFISGFSLIMFGLYFVWQGIEAL